MTLQRANLVKKECDYNINTISHDVIMTRIFGILDRASLYSCLTVNRHWCQSSIRVLWRNIWDFMPEYTREAADKLLSTLIGCLPDESKVTLRGILIPTSKRPFLYYPSFCEVLSIRDVYIAISLFLESRQLKTSKDTVNLVAGEILKMFMSHSSLRELTYYSDHYEFHGKFIYIPNNIALASFSGAKDCLRNLSELSCTSYVGSELLCQLSQTCHNIQTLNIKFKYNAISEGLKRLVSSQNNLKNLSIICDNYTELSEMMSLLVQHSKTLVKLKVVEEDKPILPLSFITEFVNLQELELSLSYSTWHCENENFAKLQHPFPHLQILKIHNFSKVKNIIKFFENSGKNLKALYVVDKCNNLLNPAIAEFGPGITCH